jgi:2-methylfumaryl-CoA isomerase
LACRLDRGDDEGVTSLLEGLQVIEGAAFVAAPSGGMTLSQLGADVIRFDPIGGGIDHRRWPLTADGHSLYWAGLNKGKRSIAVDIGAAEARELVKELVAVAGTFLTNFPARGWLSYEELAATRADLVMVAITGNRDGSTALDYTVNSAMGYPLVTGPVDGRDPVNHVLPAWDLICGQTAALAVLAADRRRLREGTGTSLSIALSDVALAAVSALGHIAEVQINGEERARYGNTIYGAFGADCSTSDGRRVYVAAISPRQWEVLVAATDAEAQVAEIAAERGLDFADEGHRFEARAEISAVIQDWIGTRSLAVVAERFDQLGVCWGPYQTFAQLVAEDPRCSLDSELFRRLDQPGVGAYLVPGSPIAVDGMLPEEPRPAPELGAHTDEVLAELLGLSGTEIGRLHDRGLVDGPARSIPT